jgi:glycosyltransferase involved in cell wall biosynthesis
VDSEQKKIQHYGFSRFPKGLKPCCIFFAICPRPEGRGNYEKTMKTTRILHLVTHPIQYYTPLYKQVAAVPDFDFTVLFCCKKGVEKQKDSEFGVDVQWDVPLLEGYNYKFLKNYAPKESLDSSLGLINFGIIRELITAPRGTIVWVHGWNFITHLMTLLVAKICGHRVFIRGDNAALIENSRPDSLKKRLKKLWLGRIVFSLVDKFLAVGKQNTAFFKLMNVADNKILFAPHSIDNQRFIQEAERLKGVENFSKEATNDNPKNALRTALGIPLSKKVLIFAGKYVDVKRPLDLLQALTLIPDTDPVFAVFVGEGYRRTDMERFIKEHQLENKTLLTGFINQSQMPRYYAAADIFVMCSDTETWGLSTNEALCFGLPVILSDSVGCADDLVQGNGVIFPRGDVASLAKAIQELTQLSDENLKKMGENSLKLTQTYHYGTTVDTLHYEARHHTHETTPYYTYL